MNLPASTPPSEPGAGSGEPEAPSPEVQPTQPDAGAPTGADAEALKRMLAIEATARDLYRLAGDAGAAAGDPDVIAVIADDHDAYAESIAGLVGVAAGSAVDRALLDERRADFETDDVGALGDAGYMLESELVATYTQLLGRLRNLDAAELVASIMIVESLHCTVLADLAGKGDDLVALLDNDADPLPMTSAQDS